MKTVQRERRYVCGQTKQNAVYQEIEIYTVGTDQKSQQREKQKVTPVPFRGKNPEHWDGHNAKRARKWFIRLLNTNFTEADTHTSLTYSDEFLPKTEEGGRPGHKQLPSQATDKVQSQRIARPGSHYSDGTPRCRPGHRAEGRPFSPSRHFEMPAYPRRDRRLLGSEEKADGDDQRPTACKWTKAVLKRWPTT